jgi:hypothetical protein
VREKDGKEKKQNHLTDEVNGREFKLFGNYYFIVILVD